MIAVDTNILVRLLVNDASSQKQIDLAKKLLKYAKQVYIPQIVQVEVVWVLESAYQFNKTDVLIILKHLQRTSIFVLEHKQQFDNALAHFEKHSADFSDYLILSDCLENQHHTSALIKNFHVCSL